MKRMLLSVSAGAALSLLLSGAAYAWHLDGCVKCSRTDQPLSGVRVEVVSTTAGKSFSGSDITDSEGNYSIDLLGTPACYRASVILDGATAVSPASGTVDFCTDGCHSSFHQCFIISSPSCAPGACWLTGGGAKFSQITGTDVGESGKRHNWGGDVNPGCSPTAGDGGSWNHIDAVQKLHFHGTHIEVVRCDNVDGIPPGSTSPNTPFNFIEYTGWGTLKEISGNKVSYDRVYFFARAEDRNEPGSNGQRDGAGKDRYFLNVYTVEGNPSGSSVLLVDVDGNPATVDPLTITDGNMQIHISGCDKAPVSALGRQVAPPNDEATVPVLNTWGGDLPLVLDRTHASGPGHSTRAVRLAGLASRGSASIMRACRWRMALRGARAVCCRLRSTGSPRGLARRPCRHSCSSG